MKKVGELKKKQNWQALKIKGKVSSKERYYTGWCASWTLDRLEKSGDLLDREDCSPILSGELEYDDYCSGNSTSFRMKCLNSGEIYDVSMKGFAEMIPKLINGRIKGQFVLKKVGNAINLYLHEGRVG